MEAQAPDSATDPEVGKNAEAPSGDDATGNTTPKNDGVTEQRHHEEEPEEVEEEEEIRVDDDEDLKNIDALVASHQMASPAYSTPSRKRGGKPAPPPSHRSTGNLLAGISVSNLVSCAQNHFPLSSVKAL